MAGLLDGLLNGNSSGDGSGLLSFLNSLGMGPGMPAADPSASFSDRFGAATPPAFGAPPASFADRFGAAPSPAFGAGASPMLFANAPGSTPGNPALPSAPVAPPIVAQDDSEDDTPAASPIAVGKNYQMPAAPDSGGGIMQHVGAALNSLGAPDSLFRNVVSNPVNALISGQTPESKQAQVANMTVQALTDRGIPRAAAVAAVQPGNGDALKKLWDVAFTAKDPMNLGSGYVLRPGATKAERLFTPDDKTPAGFTQADDGTMHFTPGGPADPAYLRLAEAQKKDPTGNFVLGRGGAVIRNNPDGSVTEVYKNKTDEPAPMDPASLEILARREIGGDFSGRKNLGRGAQGAADLKAITNKSADILTNEMGMTPTEAAAHLVKKQQEYVAQGQGLNAEARTTGVREANLNLILKAADAAIPAALEASDKVSRTGFVPLNQIIQHGEVMTSDPDLKKFGMANLQLAEHWARAMNPTGVLRESDRDKALSYLSTADSKETYKAAVGQLRTQIERERDAVKATRGMSDLPGSAATPSTPAAPPVPSGWTVQVH